MILGKPRSQPKKILARAKSIDELSLLLSEVKTSDLSEFYGLNLINRENIIEVVFRHLEDKNYLLFARGLTDLEYDSDRYHDWLNFRKKYPSVCNSDDYFKVKYGSTWKTHKQNYKLIKPNTYDVNYWISKGMTEADAVEKVNAIKYKTSMSLERCIELYGEVIGVEKHQKIHKFHKNYVSYWGEDVEGFTKYKREANRCTIDFWIKRGYTEQEAKTMISNSQKLYSGLHREFWESRGYTKEDINVILGEINSRKDGTSLEHCIKKYGNYGHEVYELRCKTKSSCYREYGKFAAELHQGYRGYSIAVDIHTRKSIKKIEKCPGIRGKKRGQFHLDHKFSKIQGFLEGIAPEIIGHPANLEWALVEINCSKRGKCSITIKELMEKINEN